MKALFKKILPSRVWNIIRYIHIINNNSWCSKYKSIFLSLKYKCIFCVGHKTSVKIEKGATIDIDGEFYFNKPWHNEKNIPASIFVGSGGMLQSYGYCLFCSGCDISVGNNAILTMDSIKINVKSKIVCFNSISIGNGTIIGDDVVIRDTNNHTIIRDGYIKDMPIVIGKHVWIGIRSTILKGVTIGDGAVIGACSLVNKSVPEKALYAGVPAKRIKDTIEWKA